MNARLLLAALVLFAASARVALKADEEDPIAAQLLKDKEVYVAAQTKAKEEMLKAFDKYYESVKNNKTLKIEAQLAQLEKIEAEKKAFEASGATPTLAGLKVALSEYRTAQKKAEAACRLGFEKAAKAYRDAGDVKAAVATLDEMKEFLARPAAAPAGVLLLATLFWPSRKKAPKPPRTVQLSGSPEPLPVERMPPISAALTT